jgi:hypothetical protein
MRFAYADPPYPGQAKRWYRDHPDYAGEVDHAELIGRLCHDYPDGWALSTAANSLRRTLILCPPEVRVAIWHVPDRTLRGNGRWRGVWEPVIIYGGRQAYGDAPMMSDLLRCPARTGFGRNQIAGQKPPEFARWTFALLGAQPGDELDDLFPGSGSVAHVWQEYESQPWMEPPPRSLSRREYRNHLIRTGEPDLESTATIQKRA